MSCDDETLIAAAREAIRARYRPKWHVVGAALRLRSGEVAVGVHMDGNIGRTAMCAEAMALGNAVTHFGSSDIETIVAVYHRADLECPVVAPCGICREMISDYAPEARVLLPDGDADFTVRLISELLPEKYCR